MLSSVLSSKTCANCRNCCVFEPQSTWELPAFSAASIRRLAGRPEYQVEPAGERFRITLPVQPGQTAQPCPFLDPESGCTLPAEEKPFACSIWPVRVMRDARGIPALTLYRGCPGVPDAGDPALRALLKNGLRARIMQEIQKDPSLILPYHSNYTFLPGDDATLKSYPQPEAVFRYFAQICQVPHGSGHTEHIRAWILRTAEAVQIPAEADAAGNVILHKPASAGYEAHPGVILQGHMDMVCAKLPDCPKDMETEGLDLVWTDEFLSAAGTTLGGDDGIAIAYIFALFEDDTLQHPPLTAIITVDEETGMDGATALSPAALDGACLVNIDSEEEGVFTVGCAGGVRVHLHYPVRRSMQNGCPVTLTVSGLTGGHSGAEIHKPLLNANTVLLRLLRAAGVPFALVRMAGGVRDNVIPTESAATVLLQPEDIPAFRQNIEQEQQNIQAEYPQENGFALTVGTDENTGVSAVAPADAAQLLQALSALPNGVQSMHPTLAMPQTSLNLGIFALTDAEMTVDALLRSASNAEKYALAQKLETLVQEAGGSAARSGDYPAWEYVPGTALEETASAVFAGLYGKAPRIEIIHAGLECGILAAKKEGLSCISVGPDLFDIHTPRERLSVPSAARIYEFLRRLLAAL